MSVWVNVAVIFGFTSAWAAAVLGTYIDSPKDENLVFLSPVFGLCVASLMLVTGKIVNVVFNYKRGPSMGR